ncbi:unnamed protein product [Acanthosepion pharaonis]|uniref:Uncharacterized protein n=1 Tax=Acanthosepion pharaonis TaxID=158019 RepID=A0A812CFN5_ACAPH|nr:unnamed protein product [Sepia pharaonis]
METVRAVMLVAIAFSLIVGINGYCNLQHELQDCVDILQPGIQFKDITGNQPTWNRTQLDHACSHLTGFFQCYDDTVIKCNDESLRKVKIIFTKTFGYICGDGRELYLKTHVCLNQEPVKSNVKECMSYAHSPHFIQTKDDACDKINDLTRCVERAAAPCGEDSKAFLTGFIKRILDGLINCGGLSHGIIAAIIAAVCVTVVLIAFVIKALIQRKSNTSFERMES